MHYKLLIFYTGAGLKKTVFSVYYLQSTSKWLMSKYYGLRLRDITVYVSAQKYRFLRTFTVPFVAQLPSSNIPQKCSDVNYYFK